MKRKKITIGLFGFGCVGYGLYEVLERTPGLKATIKTICVKNRNKQRPVQDKEFVFDRDIILRDPEINVVVELIDDADAAYEIVCAAIKAGKAVVTANKKMLADNFRAILNLQREYNVPVLYEAACCASIPIIRNLEVYYDNDLLESIEGILNGSTNYILTKSSSEGLAYTEALAEAQKLGFAESDPSLDVSGRDARSKLTILIAHAFGLICKPEEITCCGIETIGAEELRYAREKGLKLKLVGNAARTADGSICGWVLPTFVSRDQRLFGVDDEFNGVLTKTVFADLQFFVGKGAGAYPTASAVLSDLSALTFDYRYEYKKINDSEKLADPREVSLEVYLRHDARYSSQLLKKLKKVQEYWTSGNSAYVIAVVSLADIPLLQIQFGCTVVLVEPVSYEKSLKPANSLFEEAVV
jgi:homoserine dehydrogenase